MTTLENFFTNTWNQIVALGHRPLSGGRLLGHIVKDGHVSDQKYYVPNASLPLHSWSVGVTGTGKTCGIEGSFFQVVKADSAGVVMSTHSDIFPNCLAAVADHERSTGQDLAPRVVLIEPGDPLYSVGINVLASEDGRSSYVQTANQMAILRDKWELGARTDEFGRNLLNLAAANGATFVDLAAIATNEMYRAQLLRKVTNPEVRDYFENRFEPLSEAMKAAVRDPFLRGC